MAEERVQRRLAAILVADVVGYSRLIEADDEGTRARLRSIYAELIDPRITADGGRKRPRSLMSSPHQHHAIGS